MLEWLFLEEFRLKIGIVNHAWEFGEFCRTLEVFFMTNIIRLQNCGKKHTCAVCTKEGVKYQVHFWAYFVPNLTKMEQKSKTHRYVKNNLSPAIYPLILLRLIEFLLDLKWVVFLTHPHRVVKSPKNISSKEISRKGTVIIVRFAIFNLQDLEIGFGCQIYRSKFKYKKPNK